jgi:pyridoxal phosphate enzyme (YggS family)
MNKKALLGAQVNAKALKKIRDNIQLKSPHPEKVRIIAITKTFSYKAIQEAYAQDILDIGENKIQELEKKINKQTKPRNLQIHFIGHLQTNKAKKAVMLCDYIQTIDSLKIAKAINKEAIKINKKQKAYIQINVGDDPNKHGFSTAEIFTACAAIKRMTNIKIKGIMTMLPQQINEKQIKKLYITTTEIANEIRRAHFKLCTETSMGMSKDYQIALACGATNIRIGTRLYGKRQ